MNRRAGGHQRIPRPDDWADGGPAPWASIPPEARHIDLATLVRRVKERGPGRLAQPEPDDARSSAVLLALFDDGNGAEVVLTRRSQVLSSHRGEVSFPGGRSDVGEGPRQTALREAWEEVELDPSTVTVLGELDHLYTFVSRSLIVPVVATLPGRPRLRPATVEVDRILTVPLDEFLRDDTFHAETWGLRPLDFTLHFFELDDETVWGATARILMQLLEVALGLDEAAGAA